jgi:hypothetical protein
VDVKCYEPGCTRSVRQLGLRLHLRRLSYHRAEFDELFEWVRFFPLRFRQRLASRKTSQTRSAAIEAARTHLATVHSIKAGGLQKVTNVILLLDQDLGEFRHDRIHARSEHRRRFLAKQEAVLLYEAAEDLPQLLGKKFRRAVKDLGTSPELITQLDAKYYDFFTHYATPHPYSGMRFR